MSGNVFNTGPIAPQRNPEPMPEWFQPSRFGISAIVRGSDTVITTDDDHNYVLGQQVRILVPFNYGTVQINELDAFVIGIPSSTEVRININSSTFTDFIPSPPSLLTPPSIQAIGELNTGLLVTSRSAPTTTIPGAFENISPSAGG